MGRLPEGFKVSLTCLDLSRVAGDASSAPSRIEAKALPAGPGHSHAPQGHPLNRAEATPFRGTSPSSWALAGCGDGGRPLGQAPEVAPVEGVWPRVPLVPPGGPYVAVPSFSAASRAGLSPGSWVGSSLLCLTPGAPGVVAAGEVVEEPTLAALAVPSIVVPTMAPAPVAAARAATATIYERC